MANTGATTCGTGTNQSTTGVDWSDPSNITTSDDNRATALLTGTLALNRNSGLLFASNFGFSIPAGATIDGILVEIERSVSSTSGNPHDASITLSTNAAQSGVGGDDKADGATVWPTTDAYKSYGGSTDTWGFSPTPSIVNDSGFAVLVQATKDAGETSTTVRVDHVRVTIYYTEAGITYDAVSNSGIQTGSSTSWSHTCTGSNLFLAVDVAILNGSGYSISSITYNSVAMTLIGSKTSSGSGLFTIFCYGLINPATGSHTVAITLSSSTNWAAAAVSYAGVHQTTPTEGFNGDTSDNNTTASVNVTSIADNCWIHAAISAADTSVTPTQTNRNNVADIIAGSCANEDTGPKTPAGSQTMSYTDISVFFTWSMAGYAIRNTLATSPVGGVVMPRSFSRTARTLRIM